MAMMVMRDATLDDITVVIFIMWCMKLLLSLTPTLVDILGLRSKLAKKSCDKREGPFETNLWSILRGSRFLRLQVKSTFYLAISARIEFTLNIELMLVETIKITI